MNLPRFPLLKDPEIKELLKKPRREMVWPGISWLTAT